MPVRVECDGKFVKDTGPFNETVYFQEPENVAVNYSGDGKGQVIVFDYGRVIGKATLLNIGDALSTDVRIRMTANILPGKDIIAVYPVKVTRI